MTLRNRILLLSAFCMIALISGCKETSTQSAPLTKEQEKQFHAAPGQPMPEEARKAMAEGMKNVPKNGPAAK